MQNALAAVLGASPMFYIPLGRELCLWMGGVDASRSTGDKVLEEGNSIVVYPGGVAGIFKTNPNSQEVGSVWRCSKMNGSNLTCCGVFSGPRRNLC
jgi:hypothetical protein